MRCGSSDTKRGTENWLTDNTQLLHAFIAMYMLATGDSDVSEGG